MKNIYKIIAILLVAVMLLCSCSTVVETQVQPTPTPTEDTVSLPTYITSVDDIGQIVYASGRYGYKEDSKVKNSDYPNAPYIQDNGFVRYNVENNVPQTIIWNYLGVDFELQYKYSGVYNEFDRFSDDYVDNYVCDGDGYLLSACFLHGTTTPMYIGYMFDQNKNDLDDRKDPLKHISYNGTEEERINIIKLNNQEFSKNFTDYDLECTITYDEEYQKVTYTNLDEVKNTGRDVYRIEALYYPKSFCNVSVYSHVYFLLQDNSWSICYYEPDFTDDTKPSEITEETLWYAYDEVEKFARDNFDCKNDLTGKKIEYKLASTPFIPSETRINEFNGELYLIISLHLIGEWGDEDQGTYEIKNTFYVNYERLQWKMALEGKT